MGGGKRVIPALAAAIVVLLMVAAPRVRAEERVCSVKYVSAEHVYLDRGSAAGLAAGQRVRVLRDGTQIAELEVVFTAEHSASCRPTDPAQDVTAILPGDAVAYDAEVAAPSGADAEPAAPAPRPRRTREFPGPGERPVSRPGPRVTGSLALQWDHADETDERSLSSDMVRIPFRLRMTQLGAATEFRARGSLRHLSRSGYTASISDSEWRNRIREVALVRDGRRQDLHFVLGRFIPRRAATAGPIDGLNVDRRLGGFGRVGAFAGFSPDRGSSQFTTDQRTAGLTFRALRRTPGGQIWDGALALVGRYHVDGVSREYLTESVRWRDGRRLSVLQAAEIDYYRGWRKTGGRGALALTGLTLTGRLRLPRRVTLDAGYDDREPVRTWETRALPDSLFTDAGRTGWRGGIAWRDGSGRSASLRGSVRDRSGDEKTTRSWQGRLAWFGFSSADLDLSAAWRGFDGPSLSGWSPRAEVARRFRRGLRLGLEAGTARYSDAGGLIERSNTWVQANGSLDWRDGWSVAAEYRRDGGDDIAGNRLFLELRRRF